MTRFPARWFGAACTLVLAGCTMLSPATPTRTPDLTGPPAPTCYALEFDIPLNEDACPGSPFLWDALAQRFEHGWMIAARQASADTAVVFVLHDDGRAELAADQYGAPWTLQSMEETGASLELGNPPSGLQSPDPLLVAIWAGALGPLGDLRDSLGWATANAIEYPMTYQPVPPVTYMHGPEGSILVITPQASGATWQEYE